jgi:adenylate cyclase
MCEKCETAFAEHRGGTELDIALLYADVRGSTQIAADMKPAEFAALMQRFFRTATAVLNRSDAVVDKMVGDEVIAIYLPGLAGPDYRRHALNAGLELLRATGHADPQGPWLSIGVGVHSGRAFVGSIGVEGGNYQFTALGDAMNFGARLVAAARGGEMVISQAIRQDVSDGFAAEQRSVKLKGYPVPIEHHAGVARSAGRMRSNRHCRSAAKRRIRDASAPTAAPLCPSRRKNLRR